MRDELKVVKSGEDIRQQREAQNALVQETIQLRDKYSLTEKQLLDFGKDAAKKGFKIGEGQLSVEQIYQLTYIDDLMKKGVQDIQDQTNQKLNQQNNAPGAGPKGISSIGAKGVKATPTNVIADIVKNLK